jgi:enterochelin esterase-like enzyme
VSVVAPWFVLPLALAAAAAWAGCRRRPVLAAAVLLTVLTVADGVNVYFGYLPRAGDVVNVVDGGRDWPALDRADPAADAGRVSRLPIPDGGNGVGGGTALVWLPPQYRTEPDRRFPVLYLVHGSPGVPADWFRGGDADAAAAALAAAGRPLIVVAPRMSRSWLDDPECVDGVSERVQRHFVRDVVPTVDAALRTEPDRAGRLVGGMSAGGYCALNLGLRHRDLVGTILDLSGEVAPSHTGGLGAVFGPGPAAAAANTPALYAARLPAGPPTRVWFDCGSDDRGLLPGIRTVAATLAARGFPVHLAVRPGAHTFRVWRPALRDALAWATAHGPADP